MGDNREVNAVVEKVASNTPQQITSPALIPSTSAQSIPQTQKQYVTPLSRMFPLLSEATISSALNQCQGNLSTTLDMLLTQDRMDCEIHQQASYSEEQIPICNLWIRGECSGGRAAACRKRHFYIDSDTRGMAKYRPVSSQNNGSKLSRFSSPYKARLITEQIQLQREEVDLETGKKVTWYETKEQEYVDLTGSSPLKVIEVLSEDKSEKQNHNTKKDFPKANTFQEDEPTEFRSVESSPNTGYDDDDTKGQVGETPKLTRVERASKNPGETVAENSREGDISGEPMTTIDIEVHPVIYPDDDIFSDSSSVASINLGELSQGSILDYSSASPNLSKGLKIPDRKRRKALVSPSSTPSSAASSPKKFDGPVEKSSEAAGMKNELSDDLVENRPPSKAKRLLLVHN